MNTTETEEIEKELGNGPIEYGPTFEDRYLAENYATDFL